MSVDEKDVNQVSKTPVGGKPQGETRDLPETLPSDTPNTPDPEGPERAPSSEERAPVRAPGADEDQGVAT
jgi:hypothetical protein